MKNPEHLMRHVYVILVPKGLNMKRAILKQYLYLQISNLNQKTLINNFIFYIKYLPQVKVSIATFLLGIRNF